MLTARVYLITKLHAFESWREINRIRKNHRDAIYFYANLQERFYTIEENDILPDELNPDDKNLLKAFCVLRNDQLG